MSKVGFVLVAAGGMVCVSVGVMAGESEAKASTATQKLEARASVVSREQALAQKEYNLALVEKDKALREKRGKLQEAETAAEIRKATMLKSNPECAKLVVEIDALEEEIAAFEEELAAKQKRLDDLLGSDPELERLSKEVDEAEDAVETDRAAIQESIRQRMKREWGAD